MDVDRKQLKNFFNKKISIARKKGGEQRRMARYCKATGGGPGLNPLPEEDGDEEIDEQVDPRLITGTGPVIDELSVVNVPGGDVLKQSRRGSRRSSSCGSSSPPLRRVYRGCPCRSR